jgi:hypothetical protein
MGRERIRARKFIYFCIVNLIFFAIFGCAVLNENKKTEVKNEESQKNEETLKTLSERLLRSRKLLEQRDDDGSFNENKKILSLSGQNPQGTKLSLTWVLNMGLIYAHTGNPKKDYAKSIGFFKKLMKDYPQGPFSVQARMWTGILQEMTNWATRSRNYTM